MISEPRTTRTLWAPVMVEIELPDNEDIPDLDEVCEELRNGLYRRMLKADDPANHGWIVRTIRPNR